MLRSLRARLVVGVVGAAVVFLVVAAAALDTAVGRALTNEFDTVLGSKARILSIMVVEGDDFYKLVYERIHYPEYERGPDAEYFIIFYPDGTVYSRSPSLQRGDLPKIAGPISRPATLSWTMPDGTPVRLAGIRFIPRREDGTNPPPTADREMTLVVAQASGPLQSRLLRFRWLLGGVFAAATIASAAALALIVTALTRPLRHLAGRLERLGADDLSARFADRRLIAELRPVAERLDDLFGRLDAAFTREKAFTADVAHELRTPLAGLRATIDVTLRSHRDSDEYRRALAACHDQVDRLQDLVDSLLSLAQIEGGTLRIEREPVALDHLVQEVWGHYAGTARTKALDVSLDLAPVIAEADPTQARIILANLCDNAVSYAPEGGRIRIAVTAADGQAHGEVENTCDPQHQVDVARLFDRFARGDRARSPGRHCGLGLALSLRLARLLGGDLHATQDAGRFHIRFRLPLAQLPDADDIA